MKWLKKPYEAAGGECPGEVGQMLLCEFRRVWKHCKEPHRCGGKELDLVRCEGCKERWGEKSFIRGGITVHNSCTGDGARPTHNCERNTLTRAGLYRIAETRYWNGMQKYLEFSIYF